MNKQHIAALIATAAATLILTACSSTGDSTRGNREEASHDAISHIHGLGVGPTDGRLYVATHEGLFTPGMSGTPQRVGDSKDDFMGFTVAAGKTFLASGHPAPGTDAPPNRGLIESTDSGKTWKPKSLAGEVDFHALDYAQGTVYGYDSTNGLLRASKNGTDWDDRAKLQALDIAVTPEDPDKLVATTEEGVARSTDGGRTFGSGSQPLMAFVSWAKSNVLYGIDTEGGLHRSTNSGADWKKTATVPGGQPQALTAVDTRRLVAATQNGVYESRDGGKTFTKRLTAAGTGH